MGKGQLWETRPLDFWAKAKELRAGWQESIESKELVVGQGNTLINADWQAAFPAVKVIEDNPVGAMLQSRSSPYARKCRLASEVRGWGREICGYQNNCWGGEFLGYDLDGGPFPHRQFVIPLPCVCDSHIKRGTQVKDYSPVPQWMNDQTIYPGPTDPARDEPMNEHKVYGYLRVLNDMERIFGQKFDDEKMHEMIRATNVIRGYATELSILMATSIPPPLSVNDLYSVYTMGGLTKIDPEETVKFWKQVRDEVKWRAENHIAALGTERFRWIEAHPPSWHFLKYYRYMEKYGAVCLGSQYAHLMSGGLGYASDGKTIIGDQEWEYKPGLKLQYPDDNLVTREDSVRYALTRDARTPYTFKIDEYIRPWTFTDFAKIMQADGAMLGLWRCGVGCAMTRKEQAMHLREMGLSVLEYEGSQPGDRTDIDEKRYLDQLDTWMESLGLSKLERE
jgi:benzoyl-CoA reductase subunit B